MHEFICVMYGFMGGVVGVGFVGICWWLVDRLEN